MTSEELSNRELFLLGMEMRRALGTLCDSSSNCTCTACRAMWGWDHHFGSLNQFTGDYREEFDDPLKKIEAINQAR